MNKLKQKINYAPLLGCLIGAAVFLAIYGFSTLNVTYDSWIVPGYMEYDVLQHYAGWQFYRVADWAFPLLQMNNVAQPVGASAAYADVVPLAAVFFKLLRNILPQTFQYFGWLNFLNFILMGGFAWRLVAGFRVPRVGTALATVLFCITPVLVERTFRHTALGAQWFILWALCLYFENTRTHRFPWGQWAVLVCLTPLVHAYFLPMALAIMAASVLQEMARTRTFWRWVWRVGVIGAACVALCLVFGVIMLHGGNGGGGYGMYSMNLNALFNPSSFNYFAKDEVLAWSAILPVLSQIRYNYDGFNYLGLGILLALLCMAVYGVVGAVRMHKKEKGSVRRALAAFWHRYWGLLLASLALALFAVSTSPDFFGKTLFTLPLPALVSRVCAYFRSSGRLFWPVSYLLTLSAVVFAARKTPRKLGTVALAVLLCVQLFDLSPALLQKHADFAEPVAAESDFTSAEWQWLCENNDTAICLEDLFDYNLAGVLIRYNKNMQTNCVFFNRGDYTAVTAGYADSFAFLVSGAELPARTMYLCNDIDFAGQVLSGLSQNAACYRVGYYYIITNIIEGCPLQEIPR